MSSEKDHIYSTPLERIGDFQFDESVARVFPDMLKRSVPGYASILSMIGEIAEQYVVPNSRVYDLGCSLGAASLAVQSRIPDDCVIEAIDNAEAMVHRFRQTLAERQSTAAQDARQTSRSSRDAGPQVNAYQADILDIEIVNASMVILNFTLQFIPAEKRKKLLQGIADGTRPGGVLILSEKIRFEEDDDDHLLIDLHHAFKRANGYSQLEISQKRTALEKMMIPETLGTHIERLRNVGFNKVVPWFQCFNFVSILAIK